MKANRIGKIARLPRVVREELNERIEDGEPAGVLLEWLNSLPVTQRIVSDYFEGRAITEQNLSVWRQGGFVEWQRICERRALMREFLSEAEELDRELEGEEGEGEPLTDRLASLVALELAVLLREAMAMERGPERTKAILEIARELGRLRRGDHQQRRVWLEEAAAKRELDEKAEAEHEAERRKDRWEERKAQVFAEVVRKRGEAQEKAGAVSAENAGTVGESFGTHGASVQECGVEGLPVDNRPPEQRQVQDSANAVGGTTTVTGVCPSEGLAQGESK